MATLFKPMDVQVDGNGISMAGAKLYFYTTGTNTPQDTFSESDLDPSHVNTNPVVADANGLWPAIYLGVTEYKAILKTSADVALQTLDPLIVNPLTSTLTDLMDAQFGSTQFSLLQRGASEWDAVTPKTVLDNKFGTTQGTFPMRGSSDWQAVGFQMVSTTTSAVATGTTIMPLDDTIPQNTEGDEYLTLAITPKKSTSLLRIDVVVQASHNAAGANNIVAALFQDATAGALKAAWATSSAQFESATLAFTHVMTAGTTSATTFKLRVGPSLAATVTINGVDAARILGGVACTSITITEIPVTS